MNTDTIIFTGPSISCKEAKKHYPNAAYHEPIRCGDIIRCLRLNPKRLLIIDGHFEQTASVWHKEIMLALSLGIEVYGSSSMGAMRAAECDTFGMIGVGEIYESFASGNPDDDEVALVHESDFAMRIIPMCNIRSTLNAAVIAGAATQAEAETIISKLKALPYFQRAFFEHIADDTLRQWCQDNYVDQKKLDAISLLKQTSSKPFHLKKHIPFNQTIFFDKLLLEISATAFPVRYDWLPDIEKQLCDLSIKPHWTLISRLSKLLYISESLPGACKPHLPVEKWVHYYSLYDNDTSDVAQFIYEACATHCDKILERLNELNTSIQQQMVQQFSNRFRLSRRLLDSTKTIEWIEKNGLKDTNEFNVFISHMAIMGTIVDSHNIHILNIKPNIEALNHIRQALKIAGELVLHTTAA